MKGQAKRHLAIIPARSGSKSIIDKNIKEIAGKPLMAYTIEAAVESGVFSHVLLSTDSEEYARIGRRYGAEVPYLRNPAFARDNSPTWEAIKEAMDYYASQGESFDTQCLLQVTSPLRSADDIRRGYELLEKTDARSIIGTTVSTPSAEGSFLLSDDCHVCWESTRKERVSRIKDASARIYETGTLYIEDLVKQAAGVPYLDGAYALVMDRERSADINEPLDFELAAFLMGDEAREKTDTGAVSDNSSDPVNDKLNRLAEGSGLKCRVFKEAELLSDKDIEEAFSLFDDEKVNMVLTGTELDISPVLTTKALSDLSLSAYTNRKTRPRQDYPQHYRVAGGLVLYRKDMELKLPDDYKDYPLWLAEQEESVLSDIKIKTVPQNRAFILEDPFDEKVFQFLKRQK